MSITMTEANESPAKHGLAAGEGGKPERADWTIDQGWDAYTPAEHAVWKTLFERQSQLLPGRACDEFVDGMKNLPIGADEIPDFRRLSDVLMRRTGWQVVAVPGLVPDEVFFEHLANRRFPAGQFIRRANQLDYLEEPDVFHDVFGHVPMLMNPAIADYIQAYGFGGLRAQQLGVLDRLARVYWYTVEFGLIREDGGVRAYGAGILSSVGELEYSVNSPQPHRLPLQLERTMRTLYKIDTYQQTYFVIDDMQQLLSLANTEFAPLYEQLRQQPTVGAKELLTGEQLL